MTDQLVSIIIPVYNAQNTIHRCLQSIVNQTYRNIEIIVINDGSTDNTNKLIRQFQTIDPRIRIFTQKNSGASMARNLGIQKSNGDYITFVDADDTVQPTYVEILAHALTDTGSDVAACNLGFVYGNRVQYPLNLRTGVISQKDFLLALLNSIQGYAHSKMYRHASLNSLIFNPAIRMSEDLLFNVEFGLKIKRAILINEHLYNYYQTEHSLCRSSFSPTQSTKLDADRKIIDIIKKHFPDITTFYAYRLLLATYENYYAYRKSSFRNKKTEREFQKNIRFFRTQLPQNISLAKRTKILLYANFYGLIAASRALKHRFGKTYDKA